jgi:uncharacterized protein
MESPFQFGKTVKGERFINREKERHRLANNFMSGINTILLSPRRYGKSSLVHQVSIDMEKKSVRFVFMDLFNVRSEEDFYKLYLQQVLRATMPKENELLKGIKEFFKRIVPVVSFSVDPQNDLSVSFNWDEAKKSKDEILSFPELIAQKKGFKVIVCIDEFQNISHLQQSLEIEKELRSSWQHHQNVSYCLYGSKRHMMKEIFNKEERPFYRFGDLIMLNRIEDSYWTEYITKSFASTGKKISNSLSASIAAMAENHPYYVQQLSHMVWIHTSKQANEEVLEVAKNHLLDTNAIFYQEIVDQLSNTQLEMVNAAIDKVTQFSSAEAMRKYKLGTPNNISKNKVVLENKDIIEFGGETPRFVDPFFKLWFMNHQRVL